MNNPVSLRDVMDLFPPPDWVFGAEHCLIFPDPIKICFLANHKSFLESWHFDHALDDAMIRLKQILA